MPRAIFRFYAELNDHLPSGRRQVSFAHAFEGEPAVGALIEKLGVPLAEVDVVLVNGHSVGLEHPVGDGDRVSIYPVFEALDVAPLVRLHGRPLRKTRFAVDGRLLPLARLLRRRGFDAVTAESPEELTRVSLAERRILLTRRRSLAARAGLTHGLRVHERDPRRQLAEVLRRLDLAPPQHKGTKMRRR